MLSTPKVDVELLYKLILVYGKFNFLFSVFTSVSRKKNYPIIS